VWLDLLHVTPFNETLELGGKASILGWRRGRLGVLGEEPTLQAGQNLVWVWNIEAPWNWGLWGLQFEKIPIDGDQVFLF